MLLPHSNCFDCRNIIGAVSTRFGFYLHSPLEFFVTFSENICSPLTAPCSHRAPTAAWCPMAGISLSHVCTNPAATLTPTARPTSKTLEPAEWHMWTVTSFRAPRVEHPAPLKLVPLFLTWGATVCSSSRTPTWRLKVTCLANGAMPNLRAMELASACFGSILKELNTGRHPHQRTWISSNQWLTNAQLLVSHAASTPPHPNGRPSLATHPNSHRSRCGMRIGMARQLFLISRHSEVGQAHPSSNMLGTPLFAVQVWTRITTEEWMLCNWFEMKNHTQYHDIILLVCPACSP